MTSRWPRLILGHFNTGHSHSEKALLGSYVFLKHLFYFISFTLKVVVVIVLIHYRTHLTDTLQNKLNFVEGVQTSVYQKLETETEIQKGNKWSKTGLWCKKVVFKFNYWNKVNAYMQWKVEIQNKKSVFLDYMDGEGVNDVCSFYSDICAIWSNAKYFGEE